MVVKKEFLIIYNPRSGRHKVENTLKLLSKSLQRRSINYTKFNIQKNLPNNRKWFAKYEVIVVIGGDGTLRNTVNKIQSHKLTIPILLIPRGSANLIAKSLRLPTNVKRSIKLLNDGKTRNIDLAELKHHGFFIGAFALGYLSDRILKAGQYAKHRYGFFSYFISFMKQLRLPMHEFTFSVDGNEYSKKGHSLFIVNTADIFGFASRRQLSYRDGVFELVVTTNRNFISMIGLLFDFYFRRSYPHHFFLVPGTTFKVHCDEPVSVQVDGESQKIEKNYTIHVHNAKQPFIVSCK